MNNTTTICAIATAPGGALGIIRVSGPEAIILVDKIFQPKDKKASSLTQRHSHTLAFGNINDENGNIVDEVLVSVFHAPHSYTGENSVEISCHGSSYILQRIMELLLAAGCHTAAPGEYTRRAFMNGKMDLAEAEAVADLIASTTEANHRMAINQMKGLFSNKLKHLREQLLHLTSLMELELDFSDHEELEFASRPELKKIAEQIDEEIKHLTGTFQLGNALKNGIPVAIVGETNVGKSTLLNRLLGEERAIVSSIHGTTRDVIEDTLNIQGTMFRFIDTAGLRNTTDEIEIIGINKTIQKIKQADIVLVLVDKNNLSAQYKNVTEKILPLCNKKKTIILINKCDSSSCSPSEKDIEKALEINDNNIEVIKISALYGTSVDKLKQLLYNYTKSLANNVEGGVIVNNLRHQEALNLAHDDIQRIISGLDYGLSTDIISQDLRICIYHLSEITGGNIAPPEVLNNIFENFCIGK